MDSPEPNEQRFKRLANALRKREESRSIFVPPYRDEAVLKAARAHFQKSSDPKAISWWRWALAGSTGVALICLIVVQPKKGSWAREDVNRDGRVDVLDALFLARALEEKKTTASLDQNGDGKVDDTDAQTIAFSAVRLDHQRGI